MLARRVAILGVSLVLGSLFRILTPQMPLPGDGQNVAVAGSMPSDQSFSTPSDQDGAPGAGATATPAAVATPASSGAVLASDNFSNAAAGLFPSGSDASFTWGYVNGEYQIASIGAVVVQSHLQPASGDFADLTVSVDAHRGPNADAGGTVGAGCRMTGDSSQSGYLLEIYNASGQWLLVRLDAGKVVTLAFGFLTAPSSATATRHLVITCQGSTITASVDGHQAASMQDATYQHGNAALYAFSGFYPPSGGGYANRVDARFGNFVLTQP